MAQTRKSSQPAPLGQASSLLRKIAASIAAFAEIELTLTGPEARLENLFLKKTAPRTAVEESHLISTYYDTSGQDLRRKGYALRVRQDGDSFTMTVKAAGGSGAALSRRNEWSVPVSGPAPELDKLVAPELQSVFSSITGASLHPLFTSDVRRQTKVYRVADPLGGRAELEICLDRGKLESDGKSEEICELEFELVSGSAQAIYQEAARLNDITALQLQPWNKAKRGFMLASGGAPAFCKAPMWRFSELMTVEEVLSRIFGASCRMWLENHAAYVAGKDPKALALIDEALYRLRAAIDLFQDVLMPDVAKYLRDEVDFVLAEREGARDWDLICDSLLAPPLEGLKGHDAVRHLAKVAEEAREVAHEEADGVLQSKRYCALMLFLEGWIDQQGWRQQAMLEGLTTPILKYIGRAAETNHRKLQGYGTALAKLSGQELHNFMESLKRSGYIIDISSYIYGKKNQKSYRKALQSLLKGLDRMENLAVARRRLWSLSDPIRNAEQKVVVRFAAGLAVGWLLHEVEKVRENLKSDWDAFEAADAFWR
jgi:inorganic triphosphatase YgiF